MTPRIITADVARELLTAAPEGPYEACHPDDLPGRSVVVGGTEIRAPFDAFVVAIEDRERVSIANLLAAAPDLAATVVAQAAEIDAAHATRDASAQAFDDLVARVWRAATGDTHEGPASVAALLAAVDGLRRERDDARASLAALTTVRNEDPAEWDGAMLMRSARVEVLALRAILAGRTTPPTVEEIATHEAAGGTWLFFETKNAEGQPLHDAAPTVADREFNAYEAREGQMLLGHAVRWWPLDADGRPCAWPVVTEASR